MKEWIRASDKLIKFLIKCARPRLKWSFVVVVKVKSGAGSGHNTHKQDVL